MLRYEFNKNTSRQGSRWTRDQSVITEPVNYLEEEKRSEPW
jgi:hypothetical protein